MPRYGCPFSTQLLILKRFGNSSKRWTDRQINPEKPVLNVADSPQREVFVPRTLRL